MNRIAVLITGMALTLMWPATYALADDIPAAANVGFLDNYSGLIPSPDNSLTKYYLAPGASEKLSTYHSIMVDHPEVFIGADSSYKGFKPAHIAVVAGAFRAAVATALQSDYKIVTEAGEGVLLLRLALVNLDMTKDRLHVLGFTPAGLVFQAADNIASSAYNNAVRHTSLVSLSIEGEVRDSKSAELLGEFVDDFSSNSTPKGWSEFQQEMQRFGEVTNCQLKNAEAAKADRVNCRASATAK